MTTVLLIDDDEFLAPPLQEFFARYDLNLINETHPQQGLQRLQQGDVDLLILDVMLPDMDGFEVCRQLRRDEQFIDLPVLMLTARGDVMDRVIGLEIGADDYLAKPFEPRELVARIHNILRRSQPRSNHHDKADSSATLTLNHQASSPPKRLEIDPQRQTVKLDGTLIELTTSEYELLKLLSLYPERIFSRDDILNALRGIESELFSRSVDILVSRLRQKLKPINCIKTVWGKGYRFIEVESP